jgi:hypothetical protein
MIQANQGGTAEIITRPLLQVNCAMDGFFYLQ